MARIRRQLPQVNPDWLLTGEGEVFLTTLSNGNSIGTNYGTANQTIHYHFTGLPNILPGGVSLIDVLELQLQQLKAAA